MKITKHLTIDMTSSGVSAVVDVMQGDEMTRQVSVSLYDAGRPWEPPEGVEASVSFRKPDSVAGWYDTMPDGSAACTIAGNLVTAQLVPEITQISGLVSANLIFRNADLQQVGSFPFVVRVIPSPAAGKQISNPYYNVSSLKQLNEELNKKANKEQTAPMIVTLDADSNYASHAPFQMKLHAEAGGSVYLDTGGILVAMSATNDDDIAVFFWIDHVNSVIHRWTIADDNSYLYSELPIGGSAEGAVLYNAPQELTPEEQAQARANLWVKAPSVNMFNLATAVKGYYLATQTGVLTANNDMYCAYIPLNSAGSYIFKQPVNKLGSYNCGFIPLYDADKNFVRYVTVTPLEYNGGAEGQLTLMTLTASDLVGVASFGFNVYKPQLTAAMVVAGTEYPETYIPYAEVMSIPELNINSETIGGMTVNPLYKKVIAFTGDSICEGRANNGGGYAKIIGERNNMVVQNLGISGGKITTGTTSFCISESVLNMREDADYVILEGGVNDMAMDNLGTISNNFTATLDTTTFCGAFEQMIKSAIARFPGKKIGYIAVHRLKQWAPDEYNTLHQNTGYYEAAIDICKKWGIPVCNLTINCPSLYENDSLKQAYTTNADGWHPNEEGYKKYYVPKIEAWLKTL